MIVLALGLFSLQGQGQGQGGSIWDRLSFDAEGRMRGEATWNNVDAGTGDEIDDRYRGRMRLRIGAKYALMENLSVRARVSTASDGNDANNPHWDFGDGDGFNGSQMVLDRFYLDWTAQEELHVVLGKQPHAFATPPIFGDFLWDSDISPSGVTATWAPARTAGEAGFDARVAGYVATEIAADYDPRMIGAQGNLYLPVDEATVQVSSALYDWRNVDDVASNNQGNSTVGGVLSEEYLVWDTFASGTLPGGPLDEITGFLEYLRNLEESDDGIVAGVMFGSSKWVRGNYNLFFELYTLDGDAVFAPVAQDDTPIAGTGLNDGDGDGMEGAVLGGQYFVRDNVALKVWLLTSSPDGADDDPIRLRIDLDFRVTK